MIRTALIPLLAIFTTCIFLTQSCFGHIKGSEVIETTSFDLKNFKQVEVSHAISIQLIQADNYKVEVSHNDNLKDYLEVFTKGDRLIVKLKSGKSYRNTKINAKIWLPNVNQIELSGASDCKIGNFKTENLLVKMSGASNFLATLETNELNLSGSGASTFKLSGNTQTLNAKLSGASDVKGKLLEVKKSADVSASGASDIVISCSSEISASLSGASDLIVYGDPKMTKQSTSGASSVVLRKKG